MKNLKFSYSLLATLVVAAVGVSSAAAAVLQERQDCDPQYTVHPYVLDVGFSDFPPMCLSKLG